MVWIHGGGLFVDGSRDPQFTPINLVKNGVIVVTFDYRLGTFGFFATKELIEEAKAKGEPVKVAVPFAPPPEGKAAVPT